ncbi:hypothetical protein [Streptococcus sanguinis]|uniref:TreTu family toxin n=1 Tax=Streptococcus sanguinis TaxID=1305 RepID=UPI0001F817B7|nr:hypothetical protein [Streptococcus sanguinis]EFX92984.1 hypothetical protein HMPREF9398_1856 [Streptococcus sanguinis VMC66]
MLSKHDPNFEQKRFDYIAETGLDPVTGKEADEELQNYATNYTKYASSIKAGYDFLMVGAAAWSTRSYNKDLQTQRADAQINEYYQIKDAVRNSSVGSQPVVGPQLPSKNLDSKLPKVNVGGLDNPIVDEMSTVGRWMSMEEYTKMIDSGKVQMSPNGNTTYVATPSNIEAFPAAKPGSVFTEFDVNSQSLYPAGKEGWGQIPGPGSLIDRLNQKKGLPAITEMPDARNINIKGEK